MFVVGESTYGHCETPINWEGSVLACPFKGAAGTALQRPKWCRACLLSKIHSLERQLLAIANQANGAAVDKY